MIRHSFKFNYRRSLLLANLTNDLFQPNIDISDKDLSPIFRAKHHMVRTSVHNVVVGSDLVLNPIAGHLVSIPRAGV